MKQGEGKVHSFRDRLAGSRRGAFRCLGKKKEVDREGPEEENVYEVWDPRQALNFLSAPNVNQKSFREREATKDNGKNLRKCCHKAP